MSPNPYLVGKFLEHWDAPIPGIYEHKSGRGWHLVAIDPDHAATQNIALELPKAVIYCRILQRYIFREEHSSRRRHGQVKDNTGASHTAGFLRLDDGKTWVRAWDESGAPVPGPLERWIIDPENNHLRPVLREDDEGSMSPMDNEVASSKTTIDTTQHDHGMCGQCGSSRANSTYGLSTTTGSTRTDSTVGTTPGNPLETGVTQALSATELRKKLTVLSQA